MQLTFYIALLGFLSSIAQLGFFVWLHFTPSPYNFINHAVSDYGVGRTKKLFTIYLWLNNIASLAFGFVLLSAPYIPERSIIFLFVLVIGRLGLSLFPTDLEGEKLTITGFFHYVFAILTFGMLYSVISQSTPVLAGNPSWHAVSAILTVLNTISLVSLITVIITMWKSLRKFFGLIERIFIVTTSLWFLIFGAVLVVLLR